MGKKEANDVLHARHEAERELALRKQSETGMIHDTDVERAATIAFLKKTKLYNIRASAHEMQLLHTLYWTIKDRGGVIK